MASFRARDILRRIASEGVPVRCMEDVRKTSTFNQLQEALALGDDSRPLRGKTPQIKFDDFSIRDLFSNLVRTRCDGQPVGDAFIQEYFADEDGVTRLRESGAMGAVDYSMFMGITGQLLINAVLSEFTAEEFVFTKLAGNYPTKMVSGERIPGVSLPADPDANGTEDTTLVPDGMPYKTVGFGQQYVDLPATDTRGLIIPVTRLAIFADRTGLVSRQAARVGYLLGLRKEKRGLGTLLGVGPQFKEFRQFDTTEVSLDLYQYVRLGERGRPAGRDLPDPFLSVLQRRPRQSLHGLYEPEDGRAILRQDGRSEHRRTDRDRQAFRVPAPDPRVRRPASLAGDEHLEALAARRE